MKYDENKSPLGLIPPEALFEIAAVLGFGAAKYGENNWRADGASTSWIRTYSSVQRHLNSWMMGEDLDPESGKSHLSHAATQLIILMVHQMDHPNNDNRWNTGKKK